MFEANLPAAALWVECLSHQWYATLASRLLLELDKHILVNITSQHEVHMCLL